MASNPPEYGTFVNDSEDPTGYEVYRIEQNSVTGATGPTSQVIRLKYVASFADLATADNFCDTWRGRALEA